MEEKRGKKCGNLTWIDWFKTVFTRLEKNLGSVELLKICYSGNIHCSLA